MDIVKELKDLRVKFDQAIDTELTIANSKNRRKMKP